MVTGGAPALPLGRGSQGWWSVHPRQDRVLPLGRGQVGSAAGPGRLLLRWEGPLLPGPPTPSPPLAGRVRWLAWRGQTGLVWPVAWHRARCPQAVPVVLVVLLVGVRGVAWWRSALPTWRGSHAVSCRPSRLRRSAAGVWTP